MAPNRTVALRNQVPGVDPPMPPASVPDGDGVWSVAAIDEGPNLQLRVGWRQGGPHGAAAIVRVWKRGQKGDWEPMRGVGLEIRGRYLPAFKAAVDRACELAGFRADR